MKIGTKMMRNDSKKSDTFSASEELTPNLRALRLALTVSDQLLTMNVAAASVVMRALDITEMYCKEPVHIDISSNVIMISQLRDLRSEPLTLIRPTTVREANNMTIHAIQGLVYDIKSGKLSLDEAEVKLEALLKKPRKYPSWLQSSATAGIASGIALMFTSNLRMVLLTFVVAFAVERFMSFLYKNSMTTFFRQVAVACFVTLSAALLNAAAGLGFGLFEGMNPSLIVVGGIIMLLSGLAIVGAIQDAIDEYYVTANARILKVMMLTSGIVIGVLIGLYVARRVGIGIALNSEPLAMSELKFSIVGGGIAAASFALSVHTYLRAILWAGLLGAMALAIMYWMGLLGISVVPSSGIAAFSVGLIAKGFSRMLHAPASGVISAGIIPLVPGLALYNGLMQLVNHPPGDPSFFMGVGTLFSAFGIALAVAAGASFGSMLSRPFSQRQIEVRNVTPFVELMREQLQLNRKHSHPEKSSKRLSDN